MSIVNNSFNNSKGTISKSYQIGKNRLTINTEIDGQLQFSLYNSNGTETKWKMNSDNNSIEFPNGTGIEINDETKEVLFSLGSDSLKIEKILNEEASEYIKLTSTTSGEANVFNIGTEIPDAEHVDFVESRLKENIPHTWAIIQAISRVTDPIASRVTQIEGFLGLGNITSVPDRLDEHDNEIDSLKTKTTNNKDDITSLENDVQNNVSDIEELQNSNMVKNATWDGNTFVITFKHFDDSESTINITLSQLKAYIGEATESMSGLISSSDKGKIDSMYALINDVAGEDEDTLIDTVGEILEIFESYPEGLSVIDTLNGKMDKSEYAAEEVPGYVDNALKSRTSQQSIVISLNHVGGGIYTGNEDGLEIENDHELKFKFSKSEIDLDNVVVINLNGSNYEVEYGDTGYDLVVSNVSNKYMSAIYNGSKFIVSFNDIAIQNEAIPYIGDGPFSVGKTGVPVSIGQAYEGRPTFEGLTYEQLIENGDGEQGNNGEVFNNFSFINFGNTTASIVSGLYGSDAQRFTATGANASGTITQAISMIAGNKYVISAWIKPQLTSGSAGFGLFSGTTQKASYQPIDNTSENKWTLVSYIYIADGTEDSVRFQTAVVGENDFVDFDGMMILHANKLHSLTDLQILSYFSNMTYVEKGLHSLKNPSITQYGANLLDISTFENLTYDDSGNESVSSSLLTSDFIEVKSDNDYFVSYEGQYNGEDIFTNRVVYFDKNKNFIKRDNYDAGSFTSTSNTKYVKVTIRNNSLDDITLQDMYDSDLKAMLNIGSTALPYTPHKAPNTFTIEGELNDNDTQYVQGDGVDTTVVKNATGWTRTNPQTNSVIFFKDLTSQLDYIVPSINTETIGASISNKNKSYAEYSQGTGYAIDVINAYYVGTSGILAIKVPVTIANETEFLEYIDTLKFIYPLNTPIKRELPMTGIIVSDISNSYIQSDDNGVKTQFTMNTAINSKAKFNSAFEESVQLRKEFEITKKEASGSINTILVNNEAQTIYNKTVNISVPTKLSDLTNDGLIDGPLKILNDGFSFDINENNVKIKNENYNWDLISFEQGGVDWVEEGLGGSFVPQGDSLRIGPFSAHPQSGELMPAFGQGLTVEENLNSRMTFSGGPIRTVIIGDVDYGSVSIEDKKISFMTMGMMTGETSIFNIEQDKLAMSASKLSMIPMMYNPQTDETTEGAETFSVDLQGNVYAQSYMVEPSMPSSNYELTNKLYVDTKIADMVDSSPETLETSAVNNLPYIGDSSWDTPKNGIPTAIGKDNLVMPDVEGLTFSQIVDGDLPTDNAEWTLINATGTPDVFTATAQYGGLFKTVNITVGQKYYIIARVKADNADVRLFASNTTFSHSGSNEYELLRGFFTSDLQTTNNIRIIDYSSSDWTEISVDYIQIIPVPTKLASYTDAQILKFFSGADYIPKGVHGIEDLKIVSNYTNLFDYVEYNANNAYEYLIEVVSGLTYKFSESIGYKLYDANEVEISSGTASTVTATDAKYISFNSGIVDVEEFMLTLSSYTGDYVEYQAPLTYELDTPMYSNDTREYQGDGVDTTVVKNATGWSISAINSTTQEFSKNLAGSLNYKLPAYNYFAPNIYLKIGDIIFTIKTADVSYTSDDENSVAINVLSQIKIRVNKTTYPTSTDFEVYLQANDVTFIYELATPLPRTEENDNLLVERGALLVSEYGSYTQADQYGVKTEFNAKSALDLVKQVQIGVSTDVAQEKKLIEIDNHICGTHEAIQILELTAAKINPNTSKPDYNYASQSYLFPQNNTTERLYATLPSPEDWVIGTPIRIQAHITQEDTGQAVMKVDYKLFEAFGATIPATATTYTMDTYVDDSYVSGSMSNALRDGVEIDTSDITTRAFIRLEIYRDDNVYSGDLKVDDVAIFYTAYNCCDCSTVE